MGFYDEKILPWLIHGSMRNPQLIEYRRRTLARAQGRVLEIGCGSGLNLLLYPAGVTSLIGIDPAQRLLEMARRTAANSHLQVTLLKASAEALPVEDRSVDTVVSTWTLCSIPDVRRAWQEVRRVLKPGGCFLFVEHGLAPEPGVRKWQQRLTPCWKALGGGCHLNRAVDDLIWDGGFEIVSLG